jgi:hypothetical protein
MQSLEPRGFVGGGEAIGMVESYRDCLVGTVLSLGTRETWVSAAKMYVL